MCETSKLRDANNKYLFIWHKSEIEKMKHMMEREIMLEKNVHAHTKNQERCHGLKLVFVSYLLQDF